MRKNLVFFLQNFTAPRFDGKVSRMRNYFLPYSFFVEKFVFFSWRRFFNLFFACIFGYLVEVLFFLWFKAKKLIEHKRKHDRKKEDKEERKREERRKAAKEAYEKAKKEVIFLCFLFFFVVLLVFVFCCGCVDANFEFFSKKNEWERRTTTKEACPAEWEDYRIFSKTQR